MTLDSRYKIAGFERSAPLWLSAQVYYHPR
jgi:hypothetical protein